MATKNLTKTTTCIKCNFENCNAKSRKRGFCERHYKLKLDKGELETVRFNNPIESFWAKVVKGENENDCWSWTAQTTRFGYGRIRYKGKKVQAHQLSFFIHNGFWAKPMVLHSCDNPICCNPLHLRQGTAKENAKDMLERHPNYKLLENGCFTTNQAIFVMPYEQKEKSYKSVNVRLVYKKTKTSESLSGIISTQFGFVKINGLKSSNAIFFGNPHWCSLS